MSKIEIQHGDLLDAPVEALVNTVNCVGAMGKGIALQFSRKFDDNAAAYKKRCKDKLLKPGEVFVFKRHDGSLSGPQYILNFATKDHWRAPSNLAWIQTGLAYLVQEIKARGITSVALPSLGCGLGGLNWNDVLPLIETAFEDVKNVRVLVYPPEGAPDPQKMARGPQPVMSVPNALYIHLLNICSQIDFSFSHLQLQKIAYFLHEAGEPNLRLNFKKEQHGPYAGALRQVLTRWENHYTSGFGDNTGDPERPLMLHANAVDDAESYLQREATPETWKRVLRVTKLIEGLESGFGLELLATTHWVAHRENARTREEAVQAVYKWSDYKARAFDAEYVHLAWQRLQDEDWLPPTTEPISKAETNLETIADWRTEYSLEDQSQVEAFVAAYSGLAEVLQASITPLRQSFPDSVLHLDIIEDFDTRRAQLWIEIETSSALPREQVHAQLETFDRNWWRKRAGDWFGILGMTLR